MADRHISARSRSSRKPPSRISDKWRRYLLQKAIADYVSHLSTPYLDLDLVLAEIIPTAKSPGCSVDEVLAAVRDLAKTRLIRSSLK